MNLQNQRHILALLLISIGGLWLLISLGVISGRFITVLANYWPVLLIGVGLDLLGRNKSFAVPFTAIALGILILLGMFLPSRSLQANQELQEALGDTKRAEVDLKLSSAPTTLKALSDDANLFTASITDRAKVNLNVKGGANKTLELSKASGNNGKLGPVKAKWDIGLSPNVPIDLNVDAASGSSELDLNRLNLTELYVDVGSGSSVLRLPQNSARYEVTLDGGSGSVQTIIPQESDLSLKADLSSGSSNFTIAPNSIVDLNLETGSGSVRIDLPDEANIKLMVKDSGSGSLNLPQWLIRREGSGDTGLWQTEGFNPEGGQIIITLRDVGSGSISLR